MIRPVIEHRTGTAADALCLGVLAMQVFLDTYAPEGIRPDLAREALSGHSPEAFSRRLADPAITFLLAERDGHLVAFAEVATGRPCPAESFDGTVELVRLYVQRPFRGLGLGRELMGRAEGLASRAGADGLWLAVYSGNRPAQEFYRALGYREVGTAEHVFEDQVYRNRILARP